MKKFLSMLALVMALCLACGAAFAAGVDYSKPSFNGNIISFPAGSTFVNYLYHEDAPEYVDLADLKLADENDTYYVQTAATHTADAVLVLIPQNKPELRTSNPEDKVNKPATAADLAIGGNYTYFGYNAAPATPEKVDMKKLAEENPELYAEYAASAGHVFNAGYEYVTYPTCEKMGKGYALCVCGEKTSVLVDIPMLPHTTALADYGTEQVAKVGYYEVKSGAMQGSLYIRTAEAECSADGSYVGPCVDCKQSVSFKLDSKKYGADNHTKGEKVHKWYSDSEGKNELKKAPVCGETAYAAYQCSACKKYTYPLETVTVSHEWEAADIVMAPSCHYVGRAAKLVCKNCDLTIWYEKDVLMASDKKADLTNLGIPAEMDKAPSVDYFKVPKDPDAHPELYLVKTGETLGSCENTGAAYYTCRGCGVKNIEKVLPAQTHDVKTTYVVEVEPDNWLDIGDTLSCVWAGKTIKQVTYCANEIDASEFNYDKGMPKQDEYATKAKSETVKADKIPAHVYGAWIKDKDANDDDIWYRTCSVCKTVEKSDTEQKNTWELAQKNGVWAVYLNGSTVIDTSFNGLAEYKTGKVTDKFLIKNGYLAADYNGLALIDETWYFIAAGRVATEGNGLVEYDGEWFYVEKGIMDTKKNGLVEYDGETFAVACGRLLAETNGLWPVPETERFVYLAEGRLVAEHTGVVEYDNAFFYVTNGELDRNYNTAPNMPLYYNGSLFSVVGGQLYPYEVAAE